MKTRPAILLAALALLVTGAIAAELKITLPAETTVLRPGKGAELAQANCLICHSPDYIQTQPPMPRKFWEAEVKKMREKYGAPTPEETVPTLVEYLAATYGIPDAKKP
ncbi:MAG: cytochrome c [Chthoniobacter sp.]|uniref:SorB family sulfite dehydrogenase c-type cytochrome subunit n=1 Tax=Chthoniobacter sp. TaxID=2510640 RepID=UPI0032ADE21C